MLSTNWVSVPFFDWPQLYAEGAESYRSIIDQTAAAGGYILHEAVAEFEEGLTAYLGVKHAIGLSDCTNAMLLGLRAIELRLGDEVIVPSHAFIAAAQAIHFAGGTPVPVEISESDWLIDPKAIRASITHRTRAIMPVHVNGRVCAMEAIAEIAGEYGLIVVEDAAQALGARRDGRPAGTFGLWGAFSFYPSKTLGGFGDGGVLVTDDDEVARLVRAMRNHGADETKTISRDCSVWGTNSRLDNIHAAVLLHKLSWYDRAIERRREIARRYHAELSPLRALQLPPGPDDNNSYDIFQNFEVCCESREALRSYLDDRGVGTIVQWGGSGLHHFNKLGLGRDLPKTDRFFERALLLPMNHMLSDEQVAHVTSSIRAFFE